MYKHKVLITEDQIIRRVEELALELNKQYGEKTLDVVCVLKGATIFMADLIRKLNMPVRTHFVQVSTYGTGSESSGTVSLHFSTVADLLDRDVILLEDILDTGITLDYLLKHLKEKKPRSIQVCVLLDKPTKRKVNLQPHFRGFEIPDEFVIGYGLDYQELGRNLRFIAALDPSEYKP